MKSWNWSKYGCFWINCMLPCSRLLNSTWLFFSFHFGGEEQRGCFNTENTRLVTALVMRVPPRRGHYTVSRRWSASVARQHVHVGWCGCGHAAVSCSRARCGGTCWGHSDDEIQTWAGHRPHSAPTTWSTDRFRLTDKTVHAGWPPILENLVGKFESDQGKPVMLTGTHDHGQGQDQGLDLQAGVWSWSWSPLESRFWPRVGVSFEGDSTSGPICLIWTSV